VINVGKIKVLETFERKACNQQRVGYQANSKLAQHCHGGDICMLRSTMMSMVAKMKFNAFVLNKN
jgi:hypothetical protein